MRSTNGKKGKQKDVARDSIMTDFDKLRQGHDSKSVAVIYFSSSFTGRTTRYQFPFQFRASWFASKLKRSSITNRI